MGFTDFYKLQSASDKKSDIAAIEKTSDNASLNFTDQESNPSAVVQVDKNTKEIGYLSAVFLIFNRMLGSGVFSTTSTIYNLSGSVGSFFLIFAAGSVIAFSGLLVYMELGSNIRKNGGEKNYLEYMYRKPKFLVTAMYGSYIFFLGWAAGNSVVVGEYILNAAEVEVTDWNSRGIGVGVIVFCFLVNGLHVKSGLILANILGVFKLGIVIFISITGWVALGGGIKNKTYHDPHNFKDSFKGTDPSGYGVVNALYNVIWSYVGYSNANYALGEIKNPVQVLRVAAPSAFILLAILYIFVNVAYFAVVPVEEIASSGRIVAASFFKYAFGDTAEKAASVFVALSALGNVLSVIFSQGRIIQSLGREGILPFSKFWATSKPFNSPFVGLMQHCIVCIVTIVAPPAGDGFNFVLNLVSYPLNIVNATVSGGLLYLQYKNIKGIERWVPPIKASIPVTLFFFLSSLYLVVAPYIPPTDGQSVYESLPYWIHPVVTWLIFAIGVIYWFVWVQVLPYFGGYTLIAKEVIGEDGFWRNKFYKISKDGSAEDISDEERPEEGSANETNVERESITHHSLKQGDL